jgi:hypothetical protein
MLNLKKQLNSCKEIGLRNKLIWLIKLMLVMQSINKLTKPKLNKLVLNFNHDVFSPLIKENEIK